MEKYLENKNKLQLSLMGRTVMIKMNILPKLTDLFQTIPVLIKQTFPSQNLNK